MQVGYPAWSSYGVGVRCAGPRVPAKSSCHNAGSATKIRPCFVQVRPQVLKGKCGVNRRRYKSEREDSQM